MTKKFDLEGVIESLTAEIAKKIDQQSNNTGPPRIVMRKPTLRCTAVTIERFNELEYLTVQTMVNWAVANCNIPEANVRMRAAAMFDAKSVEDIDRRHYDEVIDYLADFDATVN